MHELGKTARRGVEDQIAAQPGGGNLDEAGVNRAIKFMQQGAPIRRAIEEVKWEQKPLVKLLRKVIGH